MENVYHCLDVSREILNKFDNWKKGQIVLYLPKNVELNSIAKLLEDDEMAEVEIMLVNYLLKAVTIYIKKFQV